MPGTAHKAENVFTRHIGPLPMWGWTAIVGGIVVVYALYSRYKSGSSSSSSTSTTSTGTSSTQQPPQITQFYPTINMTTPPEQTTPTPSPVGPPTPAPGPTGPPVPPMWHVPETPHVRGITVKHGMTLRRMAKEYHWTPATLAKIEQMNKTQGGGTLKPSTRLHKGQVILRPLKG